MEEIKETKNPLSESTITSEVPGVTPVMEQKKRPLFKIIILLIVLLLSGAGLVFAGMEIQKRQTNTQPTPAPDLYPEQGRSATAEWETFSSSFGYSLKTPQNFEVTGVGMELNAPESKNAIRIFPKSDEPLKGPHMNIVVFVDSKKTLQVLAKENFDLNINHPGIPASIKEEIKESTFLGNKSYEYTFQNKGVVTPSEEYSGYEGRYKFIWVENSGKQFMIMYTKTSEFDQILSTFKFLE